MAKLTVDTAEQILNERSESLKSVLADSLVKTKELAKSSKGDIKKYAANISTFIEDILLPQLKVKRGDINKKPTLKLPTLKYGQGSISNPALMGEFYLPLPNQGLEDAIDLGKSFKMSFYVFKKGIIVRPKSKEVQSGQFKERPRFIYTGELINYKTVAEAYDKDKYYLFGGDNFVGFAVTADYKNIFKVEGISDVNKNDEGLKSEMRKVVDLLKKDSAAEDFCERIITVKPHTAKNSVGTQTAFPGLEVDIKDSSTLRPINDVDNILYDILLSYGDYVEALSALFIAKRIENKSVEEAITESPVIENAEETISPEEVSEEVKNAGF